MSISIGTAAKRAGNSASISSYLVMTLPVKNAETMSTMSQKILFFANSNTPEARYVSSEGTMAAIL
ncbi:MAG: hypothetical protein LBG12_05545 [Synergistaceae bacterium]|nr:hypothetical protein [Synergistaceae bacterium]